MKAHTSLLMSRIKWCLLSNKRRLIVNICLDLTVHFSTFIVHHCFLCILSCSFLNYLFWYSFYLVGVIP